MDRLNNRPRKCLGFRTPNQVFIEARSEIALESCIREVFVARISGENTAGQAFHTALGFTEVGRMPDIAMKFERWMSLVLMQKRL